MSDDIKKLERMKKAAKFTKRDLFSNANIKDNPLSVILLKKFTANEKIQTESLVEMLYEFVNGNNRLEILFKIYDTDGDGFISNSELFEILKILNRGILDDWKIQNIVDKTFNEIGEYKLKMNLKEFEELITKRCENLF